MPPAELTRLQKGLVAKYPGVFAARLAELQSWNETGSTVPRRREELGSGGAVLWPAHGPGPRLAPLPRQRGMAQAGLGRWKEAAGDLLKAIEQGSDDHAVWNGAAILCLWNGDRRRYRELCDDLLRRFGKIRDITRSNQLAYLCTIGPESPRDLGVAVAMARRLVETRPGDSEIRTTLAAALFRMGDLAGAKQEFDESLRLNRNGGTLTDWLFLSMVSSRMGQEAEARRWLEKAEKKLEADRKAVAGKLTPDWTLPLHDELLHAEARQPGSSKTTPT